MSINNVKLNFYRPKVGPTQMADNSVIAMTPKSNKLEVTVHKNGVK